MTHGWQSKSTNGPKGGFCLAAMVTSAATAGCSVVQCRCSCSGNAGASASGASCCSVSGSDNCSCICSVLVVYL